MHAKPAYRAVNILLLVVMCLQLSNAALLWMPQYVRLILNELFFVFLPAFIFLRLTRQPVAPRVRWHWPGWKIAALALLTGLGLYPLSASSAGFFFTLLGYSNYAAPADAIPTTLLMGVLAVIAYAIMAPLCEEFLFRGVIQPVYERRGPLWGVLFVGFWFIAFHFSLLQGLSIIPLALALGLVNYRTRSLPASMLTHLGANFLAALVVTQEVFKTGIQDWILSAPAIVGGLVVAAGALAGLLRLTRRPAVEDFPTAEAALPGQPITQGRLTQDWPLLAVGLLFLAAIGAEFATSRSEPPPAPPFEMGSTPWQTAQSWSYEIRNVADAVVGSGECALTPQGAQVDIVCSSRVGAYEVKQGNSVFSSSGGQREDRAHWNAADGHLLSGSTILNLEDGAAGYDTGWSVEGDAIHTLAILKGEPEDPDPTHPGEATVAIDSDLQVLADNTWPWQIAGAAPEQEAGGSALRFNPYTWRNETQDSGPLVENRLVTLVETEEVATPAGRFTTHKVMLGSDQAAWYDTSGDPVPVKFLNGIETWYLVK